MIIEIDVKELSRFPRLRDAVHEIQPRHRFMRKFRIDSHHLRMLQGRNKPKIMTRGRHIDIAARLVGLGFHGKAIPILLRDVVFAEIVDRLSQTFYRLIRAAAGVSLHAFAASPQHKNLRSQLGAQVHGPHSLL